MGDGTRENGVIARVLAEIDDPRRRTTAAQRERLLRHAEALLHDGRTAPFVTTFQNPVPRDILVARIRWGARVRDALVRWYGPLRADTAPLDRLFDAGNTSWFREWIALGLLDALVDDIRLWNEEPVADGTSFDAR